MSIYVDQIVHRKITKKWPFTTSCHMFGDDIEQLHAAAGILGLSRKWFQDGRWPHYDLTGSMRTKALRIGAVAKSMRTYMMARLKAGY